MNNGSERVRGPASLVLMFASGFAGLGYQLIWTQQCALWMGHEVASLLAVVAAFLAGLAVGGWLLGSRIEASRRPVLWYSGCELVIAAWSILLVWGAPALSALMLQLIGERPTAGWQWSVAFGGAFLLFLPATAAMGATLPAIERLSRGRSAVGRSITLLYSSNTLGAVAGVLVSAFWLLPSIGLARTVGVCAALNVGCGISSLSVFPRLLEPGPPPLVSSPRYPVTPLLSVAAAGLLGVGYEVVVVRVLSQLSEDTVYTFALLLAIYLAGSAAGAAAYRCWLEHRTDLGVVRDRLLAALASACLVGGLSLQAAEDIKQAALDAFGSSSWAAIGAEALMALAAFGVPTLLMGAVFSHLSRSASASGIDFGRVLGANLLAGAAAPALWGVVAIPVLGPKFVLVAIALGYLFLVSRRCWWSKLVWAPAAAALGVAAFTPPLTFLSVPDGGRLIHYAEGALAAVSVIEDGVGIRRLHINNRQQEGSNATRHVDARQAWLPLLLHPSPQRALFLGLGTGATAAAAAEDPALDVVAVELLPEVIAAARHFHSSMEQASISRVRAIPADARRYVRATTEVYDVIVSDNFHPARSGSGALYTVEHFAAVRARLTAGGLFCQWLPLHQLDLESLGSIVRSFSAVYPTGWALLASNSLDTPVVGLVARGDDRRLDATELGHRLSSVRLSPQLAALGLQKDLDVLGGFVAGPAALTRFSAEAAPNTDDHPVVAYRAPHATYAPDSRPRDRLSALLAAWSLEPDQLVSFSDPLWGRRLASYWAARNRYLESGQNVQPSTRVQDMLAQVQQPLLSVLRISPDFRPAYDPLLGMAAALAHSDAYGARQLLGELRRLQPARTEASQLLAQLDSSPSTSAPSPP